MAKAGRPEGEGCDDAAEAVSLSSARRLFCRLSEALDRLVERLERPLDLKVETDESKDLHRLIRDTERALQTALDARSRLGRAAPGEVDGALDLEAARDEILGRLARLAGGGGACGVS